MQITIKLGNKDEMEILRVANELHVSKDKIVQKLKNIYLANLTEDLKWIEEMITEDKLEEDK